MPTLTQRVRAFQEREKARAIGTLTLAQFTGSGRQFIIYSDVLKCEVVFAADNARIAETEARPVYRAKELAVVWGKDGSMSAGGLRLLHEVKTRFDAPVETEADGNEGGCQGPIASGAIDFL